MEEENTSGLVHPIQQDMVPAVKPKQSLVMILVFVFIIGAGTTTGYLLSSKFAGTSKSVAGGAVSKGMEVGSTDTKTFKDTANGVLEKGGLDNGEGTHKLIRDGGPSQTAYLTSSVIDLDQFAGKKVQVWGETFSGQKAGWLMDVGRVKIIE